MEPREAYANMSAAMNATGRAMHLNMCEWGRENPWEWGAPLAQSWRMSGDHTGIWSSTKALVAASAAIPPSGSGRPWGWNDMDMLETGVRHDPTRTVLPADRPAGRSSAARAADAPTATHTPAAPHLTPFTAPHTARARAPRALAPPSDRR
jgi:hypothetical protein